MNFIDEYNKFVRNVKSLIALEDYTKAEAILREGLVKDPNDGGFLRFYLTVLLKLKKFEEAKLILIRLISWFESKDSYQTDVLYYKGLYCFLNGNLNRSMNYLKMCFELDISYFKKVLYDTDFDLLRDSVEFEHLITPEREFVVNEYISLRLLFSKTLIYVCKKLFLTCQTIALNIAPVEFEEYVNFSDIDDIVDFYNSRTSTREDISITPEEEFWGHCSNLQAWVENDYNTCVLSKYISFPLLKELHKKGIPQFTLLFKREFLERIRKGGINTLVYFLEDEDGYLQHLTEEELFENLLPYDEAEIMKNISQFIPHEYTLTISLRDSREFGGFRAQKKLYFCVEKGHVVELEVLLGDRYNDEQYHRALLQIKNLQYLEEIEIYSDGKFLKALSISRK